MQKIHYRTILRRLTWAGAACLLAFGQSAPAAESDGSSPNKPWIWPSEPPPDCPFQPSRSIVGIAFTGRHSDYHVADTWYPSWAADGRLYSPFTDGSTPRLDGGRDASNSARGEGRFATTGQAVLEGDDPLNLKIYSLGLTTASAAPYGGRYPCGSLVYRGVWYYGTYCLSPKGGTRYGSIVYNWPWLGPLVGFRISTDYGRTWKETPHTPSRPLFGETGMWGHPVKIGAPHFVDFGRDMQYSPDGMAYLTAHGATEPDPKPRFANLSWISGDQIYLLRVRPAPNTINDAGRYEFYAGADADGAPVWTRDFSRIRPLIDWNNNCGSVTVTYDAPLKKYLMCVTDGWPTYAKMNSYILEADALTGPWRLVTYMKAFGEQGYFLNFPSKFISPDGRRLWLCYSANFARGWNNQRIRSNPPGSHYGLVLQEVLLLTPETYRQYEGNPRPQ
ncbi:MAG: hypothetical protein J7M29_09260 [Verrucomicrobia bacterium]|nr:hypothetical protein [Verrucomicrobiota bacterium]